MESREYTLLKDVERAHIIKILAYNMGNKAKTARILGITTKTLYNKLRIYGIASDTRFLSPEGYSFPPQLQLPTSTGALTASIKISDDLKEQVEKIRQTSGEERK